VFTEAQHAALASLRALYPGPKLIVLGATALRLQGRISRYTADVDLAIALELDEYPGPIARAQSWRRDPAQPHTWIYRDEVEVDLLPVGPSLLKQGYIEWPAGFRMSLEGFGLLFSEPLPVADECHDITMATVTIVAFLKMIAWLDGPGRRARDLEDLGELFSTYLDERNDADFDRIVQATQLGVPYDAAIPFLLGQDIGRLPRAAAAAHRFVAALDGPYQWMRSRFQKHASLDDDPKVLASWAAFKTGLGVVDR
jgi:predicted nucleotidyltransferase